jgi:hypothetical protein
MFLGVGPSRSDGPAPAAVCWGPGRTKFGWGCGTVAQRRFCLLFGSAAERWSLGSWGPGRTLVRTGLLWDWRAAAVPHGCLLGLGGVACDGVPGRTSVRLGWPCTREPNSGEGRAPASGVGSWGLEGPDAWFARPRRSLAKSSARVLRWASLLMGRFVGPARSAGPALRLRRWCGGVRGGAAAGLLQFRRSPRGR